MICPIRKQMLKKVDLDSALRELNCLLGWQRFTYNLNLALVITRNVGCGSRMLNISGALMQQMLISHTCRSWHRVSQDPHPHSGIQALSHWWLCLLSGLSFPPPMLCILSATKRREWENHLLLKSGGDIHHIWWCFTVELCSQERTPGRREARHCV